MVTNLPLAYFVRTRVSARAWRCVEVCGGVRRLVCVSMRVRVCVRVCACLAGVQRHGDQDETNAAKVSRAQAQPRVHSREDTEKLVRQRLRVVVGGLGSKVTPVANRMHHHSVPTSCRTRFLASVVHRCPGPVPLPRRSMTACLVAGL